MKYGRIVDGELELAPEGTKPDGCKLVIMPPSEEHWPKPPREGLKVVQDGWHDRDIIVPRWKVVPDRAKK